MLTSDPGVVNGTAAVNDVTATRRAGKARVSVTTWALSIAAATLSVTGRGSTSDIAKVLLKCESYHAWGS